MRKWGGGKGGGGDCNSKWGLSIDPLYKVLFHLEGTGLLTGRYSPPFAPWLRPCLEKRAIVSVIINLSISSFWYHPLLHFGFCEYILRVQLGLYKSKRVLQSLLEGIMQLCLPSDVIPWSDFSVVWLILFYPLCFNFMSCMHTFFPDLCSFFFQVAVLGRGDNYKIKAFIFFLTLRYALGLCDVMDVKKIVSNHNNPPVRRVRNLYVTP